MDKRADRKSHRINGNKNARIGIPLGIHDKNGKPLHTGDKVKWQQDKGILLWNQSCKKYYFMLTQSKWYGDNEYDAESYGKGFELRLDDGARMEMELITSLIPTGKPVGLSETEKLR